MTGRADRVEHARDQGASARPASSAGPFAPPKLPPPLPDAEPVELLRLAVVVKRNGRRDFIASVERDDETAARLAGCRASDPLAAITGATAAALEVLRTRVRNEEAQR
jgi:hypothetical protein